MPHIAPEAIQLPADHGVEPAPPDVRQQLIEHRPAVLRAGHAVFHECHCVPSASRDVPPESSRLTRAYIATRMPNLLVMPASRRTAGPRTAFPAGSGHDAVRLKPAFTGRHHMNARLGVHNQVNLDPSTLGSKAARLAAGSGRRTRGVSGPGRHTARF